MDAKQTVDRAILLVDHGSRRDEANALLEQVAALLREKVEPTEAGFVAVAHMELAAPSIADGFAACVEAGASEIVVFPYMLAAGRHASEDIPKFVREVAQHYPDVRYRVVDPIGLHPLMVDIVLDRCFHTG